MPKPRKRYEADDLSSTRSPKVTFHSVSLLPISSIPPSTGDPSGTNTDAVKNLAAKPNLKILNKMFQIKKSRSQEFMDTDKPENEYEEVAKEQTLNGCYILRSNGGLPREYLPPPPFAPGF